MKKNSTSPKKILGNIPEGNHFHVGLFVCRLIHFLALCQLYYVNLIKGCYVNFNTLQMQPELCYFYNIDGLKARSLIQFCWLFLQRSFNAACLKEPLLDPICRNVMNYCTWQLTIWATPSEEHDIPLPLIILI
jgi:hypothetical protein